MRLPHAVVVAVVVFLGLAASATVALAQEPAADASAADRPAPAIYEVDFRFLTTPPRGMPHMPLPAGAPPTRERFELGRALFHDALLSADRTVSCASCHPAATAFASAEPRPAGARGRRARTHAPTLVNRGYGRSMRWDGSVRSLEEFVLLPIEDADEMGLPLAEALARLAADARYSAAFAAAFADGVTADNVATALATFVRGIVATEAPVDRFQRGEHSALTAEQRAGLWLFESKGGCWRCHPPPLFTDENFHNTGVGARDGVPAAGRANHTGSPADAGRFKTPTLRAVSRSAPYMHDGSLRTLEEVVDFYARGGNPNGDLDPAMRPLELSAEERANLLAFLRTL